MNSYRRARSAAPSGPELSLWAPAIRRFHLRLSTVLPLGKRNGLRGVGELNRLAHGENIGMGLRSSHAGFSPRHLKVCYTGMRRSPPGGRIVCGVKLEYGEALDVETALPPGRRKPAAERRRKFRGVVCSMRLKQR